MSRIKNILTAISVFGSFYFIAWTVEYISYSGSNMSHYAEYLYLAWTGNAFEVPAVLHLSGIASGVVGLIIYFVWRYWTKRRAIKVRREAL